MRAERIAEMRESELIDAYGFSGADWFGLEQIGNEDIGETTGKWARRFKISYVTPYAYPFTSPVYSD